MAAGSGEELEESVGSARMLKPEELYRRCDPEQLPFQTTAEISELTAVIGQGRAEEAVKFGLGIRQDGYNLFALGPAGVGRHSLVSDFLHEKARQEPTPSDWCYLNNFDDPQKPRALKLPAGQGAALRQDLAALVGELRSAIPGVFDSEDYRTRKQTIEAEVKERRDQAFEEVRHLAEAKNIGLLRTPTGLVFAPIRKDQVLDPDEFNQLPADERQRIETEMHELQEQLQKVMSEAPRWEKKGRDKIRDLNRDVTIYAVGHLMEDLRKKYAAFSEVVSHLNAVQQDVVENVDEFLSPAESSPLAALMGTSRPQSPKGSPFFRRYQANLLVDHSSSEGAPVVYEDNPTHPNLLGEAEYVAQMGALVTDFTLIKPGALHRANGGFLIVDALRLLQQPFAWEGLKRALRSGELRIESPGQMVGLVSTVSLEPESIPLSAKVVLVGERSLYYLLTQADPDFNKLFKVAVDFEDQIGRNAESQALYARFVAALGRETGLLPFDRQAVARVIEHSARLAGDAEKLSTHRASLQDLLREADYWARQSQREVVTAADVEKAIDARIQRYDRVRERQYEEIQRGTILIDTQGEKIGQVNGLSVVQPGRFAFGQPSRITARVRLGRGEVIDIEREVELGGPIHSKGVLILSGFLGERYASDSPLSLSASLVFEQSYGGVEGDSASAAELYTLMSALARLPIRQSLACTGSVNQHGQVQPIGGVNEKIEGFFDVCRARGLTGDQGVMIPASNVKHLMLRKDVVEAVAAGKFHVYAVETIDQGIEVLTGTPAGERDASGAFPEGTVNHRVEARLKELAAKRMAFARTPPETAS
jgi:lon-related putative ATP-dependent protease